MIQLFNLALCYVIRDTSACISFNLVKNCDGQYVEEWVNFDTEKFETTDLPLRKRQLPIRIHDCQHTLDVLMQLNDGRTIDHLTLSTLDVSLFKVKQTREKI